MSTTDPAASALDGLVNLRDLGGLPAEGGALTRPGVLYRSDAPYQGDRHPTAVEVWPPELVIDLRDRLELNGRPHPLEQACAVQHMPVLEGIRHKQDDSDGQLTGLYQLILDWADEWLLKLFRAAAQAEGPVLLHCAAGKDRTGVSVALLLSAAGVDRDAIVEDYLRTDQNMFRVLQRLNVAPQLPPGITEEEAKDLVAATPPSAIESVVQRFDQYSDGAAGWLAERGVTDEEIDQWRRRLLKR